MAKKESASSAREKQLAASALFTNPIGERERHELETLAGMADSEIDYSDTPAMKALPPQVHVGRFYRPLKQKSACVRMPMSWRGSARTPRGIRPT
jgi:hypothetical protein